MSGERRKDPIASMPANKFLDLESLRTTSKTFSYFDASCFAGNADVTIFHIHGLDAMEDRMREFRQWDHAENVAFGEHITSLRRDITSYARAKRIDLHTSAEGDRVLDKNLKILFTDLHSSAINLAVGNYGLIPYVFSGRFKFPVDLTKEDREDMSQVGFEGLLSAAKRYDPWYGKRRSKNLSDATRFSTYAIHYITGYIKRSYPQMTLVRLPHGAWDEYRLYRKVINTLTQEGIEPTDETIAVYMKAARKKNHLPTEQDVEQERRGILFDWHLDRLVRSTNKRIQRIMNALYPLPLESDRRVSFRNPNGELDQITFEDKELVDGALIVPSSEDANIDQALLRQDIDAALNSLPPRERKILKDRNGIEDGIDYTLEEVGKRLGITRERVRQIESQALRRLRRLPIQRILRRHLPD